MEGEVSLRNGSVTPPPHIRDGRPSSSSLQLLRPFCCLPKKISSYLQFLRRKSDPQIDRSAPGVHFPPLIVECWFDSLNPWKNDTIVLTPVKTPGSGYRPTYDCGGLVADSLSLALYSTI
ncbi:hypothetical protein ACLOJK_032586 [Asimina triloba]